MTRYEAEFRDLGDFDHLNEQKTKLQNEIRSNKVKLSDFAVSFFMACVPFPTSLTVAGFVMQNDQKQMDISLKATNKQIEGYDRQIAEEARRLEADTGAKREETQRKLDKARTDVTAAQTHLNDVQEQKRLLTEQCETAKNEGMQAGKEQGTTQGRIRECEDMIERCVQQEKNSLAAYGRDIKGVLERIGKMRWAGDVPLGPLGVNVKVREPEKWAELLRGQLGGYLTAFAVTDARDRTQLKKVLEQSGK